MRLELRTGGTEALLGSELPALEHEFYEEWLEGLGGVRHGGSGETIPLPTNT